MFIFTLKRCLGRIRLRMYPSPTSFPSCDLLPFVAASLGCFDAKVDFLELGIHEQFGSRTTSGRSQCELHTMDFTFPSRVGQFVDSCLALYFDEPFAAYSLDYAGHQEDSFDDLLSFIPILICCPIRIQYPG